jgi:hypothetical protein
VAEAEVSCNPEDESSVSSGYSNSTNNKSNPRPLAYSPFSIKNHVNNNNKPEPMIVAYEERDVIMDGPQEKELQRMQEQR